MKKLTLPDSPGFNLLAGLASLLLLSLLIVFVARGKAQDISAELRQKANLALKDRGLVGVAAQVDGRNVVLTGQTTLDSTRIQAADAIQRIAGVAEIANRIEVNRSQRSRQPTNNRPTPPVLSPRPAVERPNLNNQPVGSAPGATAQPAPVITKPRPAPIVTEARPAVPQPVVPKPVVPKPVVPKPVLPKPVVPKPANPSPVTASPRVAAAPPVAARPVQPTAVTPPPIAPERTTKPATRRIPPAAGPVAAATNPFEANSEPKSVASSRLATASATPKPYVLQLALENGGVNASGYLPDEATLLTLEQRVKLNQPINLKQADAPPQFTAAVELAALAASQLSRGKVRIADRQISIEGWVEGSVDEFTKRLQPALPPGYTFTARVSSNRVTAPGNAAATTMAVDDRTVAVAETVAVELVDDQQFVREALACQADIDGIMSGRTVEFKFASDALETRSEGYLREIATAMNRCPSAYLYVIGHTDSVGTQERNQRLSQRRASSVADYLVSQGVYSEFVIAEGRGEKEPIFSNQTEDGRARNRRIEFSVRSEPSL